MRCQLLLGLVCPPALLSSFSATAKAGGVRSRVRGVGGLVLALGFHLAFAELVPQASGCQGLAFLLVEVGISMTLFSS